MNVYENINRLVGYALKTGLIRKQDVIYTQNRLLELFALDGFETPEQAKKFPAVKVGDLENILAELLDFAGKNEIFPDEGIVRRDLFDTKIMGFLVPPPSDIIDIFETLCAEADAKSRHGLVLQIFAGHGLHSPLSSLQGFEMESEN